MYPRTKKVAGGNTTHYVYGPGGALLGEYDGSGVLIREYIHLNGEPLAQIDKSGATESILYLHTDHLLTARYATNAAGSTVWSWDSGAFGKEAPTGSATINLRFPGQYFDAETGLHYNWHRYYDPATGRYITSDPLGLAAGLNTYGYAAQNPLSFTDPDGQNLILGILGVGILIYSIYDTVVAYNQYANGEINGWEFTCRLSWNWGPLAIYRAYKFLRGAGVWLRGGMGASVGDDIVRAAGMGDDVARAESVSVKLLAAPNVDKHHIFPQQFRSRFKKAGINIDDFIVKLDKRFHARGVHGTQGVVGPGGVKTPLSRWNDEWRKFFQENPNATPKEIYQKAGELMDRYGLSHLPISHY